MENETLLNNSKSVIVGVFDTMEQATTAQGTYNPDPIIDENGHTYNLSQAEIIFWRAFGKYILWAIFMTTGMP